MVNVVTRTRSCLSAPELDLGQQVVDLRLRRAHIEHRIDESGRANDLLDDLTRVHSLVFRRRRRHEHRLRQQAFELVEAKRPVVERGRQAEAVVDEVLLARAVALVHAAGLRNRHVRLVDEHQRARRQVIDQCRRRLARLATGQMARVVLDPLAKADLGHHLEVEARPLLDPLRFDQFHLAHEEFLLRSQFDLDLFDGVEHLLTPGHVVARREHREAADPLPNVARQGIEKLQGLYLIVEERKAQRVFRVLGRKDVQHVAAHAKRAAPEVDFVALVLHLGQALDRVALGERIAFLHVQDHAVVFGRVADAVDRRDGRDDDAIRPLEDRLGRRQPHLLDVLVDRRILLDVEVPRGHVGLGLVVVVIADEILDGVVREEFAELRIELRRKRLVRRQHERWAARPRDDVRHRVRLARAGDAQQCLEGEPVLQAFDELVDRLRLVAGRLERLEEFVGAVRKGDEHCVMAIQAKSNRLL